MVQHFITYYPFKDSTFLLLEILSLWLVPCLVSNDVIPAHSLTWSFQPNSLWHWLIILWSQKRKRNIEEKKKITMWSGTKRSCIGSKSIIWCTSLQCMRDHDSLILTVDLNTLPAWKSPRLGSPNPFDLLPFLEFRLLLHSFRYPIGCHHLKCQGLWIDWRWLVRWYRDLSLQPHGFDNDHLPTLLWAFIYR